MTQSNSSSNDGNDNEYVWFEDFTEYEWTPVRYHIETYVNRPEAWNEACPEVRKRPDSKSDKFASDEVDTYTMTLSAATFIKPEESTEKYSPFDTHPAGKKLKWSNKKY